MKIMKKILCTVLVVVMCLTSAPLQGFVGLELPEWNLKASATNEYPTSGQCGDNAYWKFDKNTGTLTISGTGATWNYASDEKFAPEYIEFYQNSILKLVVEEGITGLGAYTFHFTLAEVGGDYRETYFCCPNLSEISLPDSLEIFYAGTFDHSAYYNDESNWEDDVLYIDDCFFQSKEGSEGTLIIKEGTTRMAMLATTGSNYTNVIFPESMKVISDGAFLLQSELKSIHLSESIEKIGASAFGMCTSLETITGLKSVKEIGESAFGLCYKLKSINLSSTEKIDNMAFMGCLSLEDIDLSSAKEIGEQAFMLCSSISNLVLPSNLKTIGAESFSGFMLSEVYVYNPKMCFGENSINPIIISDDFREEIIRKYILYYDLLFSSESAEAEKTMKELVQMVDEIDYEIGTIVCYEGSTAETYAIENGINYRYFSSEEPERTVVATGKCGDNAYYTLYSDGELVISGEGEMWDSASPFFGLDIKKVIIENGITTIGEEAFDNCYSIESVEISNSVKTIGNEAFYKCIELKEISLGSGVETIGKMAFYGCWFLEEITIPKNVKNIGDEVFTTCYQLKNISVDSNNITYSNDEFGVLYNKDKTVLVQYPSGNLRNEYAIPESVEVIAPNAFSNSKKLEKITIGENVSQIEMNAFNGCIGLVNIEISDNVEYIADLAFGGCENLVTVTMGKSIEQIDGGAFAFCFNLTDIYYNGTEQEWNKIAINEDNQEIFNATIHFLGEEEEDCTHKETFEQTIPASCTVSGMKFTVCVDCGETIGNPEVIPAAHTPGEWETVIEPTYEAEGKKVKKCTVCGETLEEEIIPKLELAVVEDEETGVGLEFPAENYDGKVEIEVEESFDGTAFNILDTKTGAVDKKIYNIKMLVDGEVTQPNGKVKVKLPLPAGYNPKFSFVYYINTEKGTVEKMKATYEDSYMVFETDHFSYYAVIAEPDIDNCSCSCHKNGIAKFFFNFLLFFQKLFKANKICKCGINHY